MIVGDGRETQRLTPARLGFYLRKRRACGSIVFLFTRRGVGSGVVEHPNGIAAWNLAQTEGLRALVEETDDVTVGESRFLADAVNFAGGHDRSPLAKSVAFYRWLLAGLRAAMNDEPSPEMPEEAKRITEGERRGRK